MTAPVTITPARRVASLDAIERAGDYYGPFPVDGYPDGTRQMVRYLLPVHHGADKYDRPDEGSGLHSVTSPPHRFRECPDGSLEIRESIGCGDPERGYYWHGYLDEGNRWRQLPS